MSRFLILELDGVLPDCDPARVQLEVIETNWAHTTLFATCGIDSVPVLAIHPVLPGGVTEAAIDANLTDPNDVYEEHTE